MTITCDSNKVYCYSCDKDQDNSDVCDDCGAPKFEYAAQYFQAKGDPIKFIRSGFFRNTHQLYELMNRWNSQIYWKYWRD